MSVRVWPAALAAVLLAPPLTFAAEAAVKPAVVVQLPSFDGLVGKAGYLAGLVRQGEKAKEVEAFVRTFLGDEAFEAVDPARPLAAYADAAGGFSAPVLVLPVGGEDKLVGLLKRFGLDAEKDDDGVYSVEVAGVLPAAVHFRVSGKHAFVAFADKRVLAKDKLADPASLFVKDAGLARLTVRLDRIPDVPFKQIILSQMELKLADGKEAKPGETDAATKFKATLIDAFARQVKHVLTQGRELTLRLDLDEASEAVTAKLELTGKPGSALATDLMSLAGGAGRAAAMFLPKTSLSAGLRVALPDDVTAAIAPLVDEVVKQGVAKAEDDKKDVAEALLTALAPTVKAGVIDVGVSVTQPDADGRVTMVFGVGLADAGKVEKAVKGAVAKLPEEARALAKLDDEKAGAVSLHRLNVGGQMDGRGREMFGTGPLYLAFRPDAAVLAVGPAARAAAKEAATAAPRPGPVLAVDLAASTVAQFQDNPAKAKAARQVSRSLFQGDPKGRDTVSVRVSGGERFTAEVSVKTGLLTFGYLLGEREKKAGGE